MESVDSHSGTAVGLPVVVAENDHSFTLDESALEKILLDPRVKDSNVIVLSVAGAYRKGKSFILNFFLRYLSAQGSETWIGDPNAPLSGFEWKGGMERNTSGIIMWSEPFEVSLESGEKAWVLLMDTQGTFDRHSIVKDCATIFALSTMLSSVQVYNIMTDIQENDLQNLEYFTEYGRLALERSTSKPFQDLHFLVRDWRFPYQHQYGWKGGETYLAKYLETEKGQHEALQQPRQHIRSCFSKVECFLMPHPGKNVVTSQHFDGRLSDVDNDFIEHLQEFVKALFLPGNLVVKTIDGTKITGTGLFELFKEYYAVFNGNELPEPMSVFEATVDVSNRVAVGKAIKIYTEGMEQVCGLHKEYVDTKILKEKHDLYLQKAVQLFQDIPKMGCEEKILKHQQNLESDINESFARYDRLNSAKKTISDYETLGKVVAGAGALTLAAIAISKGRMPNIRF